MSKPVHPATVHFPIAFLTLAYALDILSYAGSSLPAQITAALPPSADLPRLSYHLLSLGLITAIPAIMSGGQQLVGMISKQGLYEADGKTLKAKVKAAFAHAVFNDIVMAASGYIWYLKKQAASETLASKVAGEEAGLAVLQSDPVLVGAQVVLAGLLMFASSIGGALTYNYGVGFAAAKTGPKKTQ